MTIPSTIPKPRMATVRDIVVPDNKEDIIDRGIVLYFKSPNSYTGEDCVELQVHGSIAVIRDILSSLSKLENFAPSEPGEFTKRAWYNNKFSDLTAIEAVSDLIHSETSIQRKQAFSQYKGDLGNLYNKWSQEIYKCLAHLEAYIDFGDDELLDDDIFIKIIPTINKLIDEIKEHLNDNRRGEIIRNGVTICLVGSPNVGKSSLMNVLSKRDVSIVSNESGTTRDVIETRLDINGYPIILQDTAGLNDNENIGQVEREGIRRSKIKLSEANIKMIVLDLSDKKSYEENKMVQEIIDNSNPNDTIVVFNKSDLNLSRDIPNWIKNKNIKYCFTSCKDIKGFDDLINTLTEVVTTFFDNQKANDGPVMTRERYRHHLKECLESLENCLLDSDQIEIASEDLRVAGRAISRITGKVDVEDILDIVFRDFCIGK